MMPHNPSRASQRHSSSPEIITMTCTITGARILLALAFAGFGLQYLRILPFIGPPWYPVHHALSIAAGIALLAAAVGLAVRASAHLAACLLGAGLFIRVLVFHLAQLIANLHNPNIWTVFGEVLALAAGACMLASVLPASLPTAHASFARILSAARYLFAATLVIFGVLHFKYAFFISLLIPKWIPERFFFANFVGLCFLCAALAIASGVRARLAAYMLAAMFLLWVAILHAPRVAAAPHNGNEWTSMLVALAMAGGALAAAAIAPAKS
jgi:hypothetical protein